MKNILITSAGRRVSLVRAFAAALSRHFPSAHVFAAEANPDHSAACQVSHQAFHLPRLDDPDYLPALLELAVCEGVGMIVPTIDTELQLLADDRPRFAAQGIEVIISSSELVRQFRHKRRTHDFFQDHAISVPRSIDPKQPTFPMFVKPVDGSSSQGIAVVENASQLSAVQQNLDPQREFLFLEMVDLSVFEEFTVDLYYRRDHQLRCIVPRKRIEVRGGEVSKGVTARNDIIPFLRQRMSEVTGAIGCLTLQLFRNLAGTEYYGIEINPRFGGGYPLSFQAGASFPEWLIREYFLNQSIDWFDGWEDRLLMLRYDEEILIHDAR